MKLLFGSKFTPLLTGFRKFDITQNALLNMIEKWKHALNKCNKNWYIFMDLSKALDSLNHNTSKIVMELQMDNQASQFLSSLIAN